MNLIIRKVKREWFLYDGILVIGHYERLWKAEHAAGSYFRQNATDAEFAGAAFALKAGIKPWRREKAA
jgi:hypothetical protein